MDYLKLYSSIVENARLHFTDRLYREEYFENHHIVPSSAGGTDEKENLVLLTAREHYLCHWILYKIYPTKENAFSWWMMSNNSGNKYHKGRSRQTSRKYEYARIAFSKHISKLHKGKTLSEEHRKKLSSSKLGSKNGMHGQKHSEDHKKYLSEINSGDKNGFFGKSHTEESRIKISESKKKLVGIKHPHFGKTDLHSDETKRKFSEMYKGKPRLHPHEIVKCPYCGKEGIKPNMKRWHFDNCKNKENINESVDKLL